MKFEYNGVEYCGTRAEIIRKLESNLTFFSLTYNGYWKLGTTITVLRDCSPSEARKELTEMILKSVPQTLVIGNDKFSGTKAEILEQFIRVQKVAPAVFENYCDLKILGVSVSMVPGEHTCKIRDKVIAKVKRIVNDL